MSCILVCNIVSVESNYALGYLVIGIAGIYIGSSLLVMIYTTFKEIKRRIRNKLVIRAYFKQRVKLKHNLQIHHSKRRAKMRLNRRK